MSVPAAFGCNPPMDAARTRGRATGRANPAVPSATRERPQRQRGGAGLHEPPVAAAAAAPPPAYAYQRGGADPVYDHPDDTLFFEQDDDADNEYLEGYATGNNNYYQQSLKDVYEEPAPLLENVRNTKLTRIRMERKSAEQRRADNGPVSSRSMREAPSKPQKEFQVGYLVTKYPFYQPDQDITVSFVVHGVQNKKTVGSDGGTLPLQLVVSGIKFYQTSTGIIRRLLPHGAKNGTQAIDPFSWRFKKLCLRDADRNFHGPLLVKSKYQHFMNRTATGSSEYSDMDLSAVDVDKIELPESEYCAGFLAGSSTKVCISGFQENNNDDRSLALVGHLGSEDELYAGEVTEITQNRLQTREDAREVHLLEHGLIAGAMAAALGPKDFEQYCHDSKPVAGEKLRVKHHYVQRAFEYIKMHPFAEAPGQHLRKGITLELTPPRCFAHCSPPLVHNWNCVPCHGSQYKTQDQDHTLRCNGVLDATMVIAWLDCMNEIDNLTYEVV